MNFKKALSISMMLLFTVYGKSYCSDYSYECGFMDGLMGYEDPNYCYTDLDYQFGYDLGK